MIFNSESVKKFENLRIKIWFYDRENRMHRIIGGINKINEDSILFDVNNENSIIKIKYNRIKYIMYK